MIDCERCADCKDCDHHWIPNPSFGNDEAAAAENPEAEYVCKHCPALGQECDACDGNAIIYANDQDETGEPCLGCNGLGVIPLDPKEPTQ